MSNQLWGAVFGSKLGRAGCQFVLSMLDDLRNWLCCTNLYTILYPMRMLLHCCSRNEVSSRAFVCSWLISALLDFAASSIRKRVSANLCTRKE